MLTAFKKDVTVTIPVYNAVNTIAQAVLSVVNSGCKIFITDNGSTDGTHKVCAELMRRYSNIEYYRAPENQGGYINSLRCAEMSTTPYVFLMRDRDLVEEGAVERLYAALEGNKLAVMAAGQQIQLGVDGQLYIQNELRQPELLDSDNPGVRAVAFFESLYFIPFYALYRREQFKEMLNLCGTIWDNIFGNDLLAVMYLTLKYKWIFVKEAIYFCRDKYPRNLESVVIQQNQYFDMFKMSKHERKHPHNRCGRALVKLLDEHLDLPQDEKEYYSDKVKRIFIDKSGRYNLTYR